MTDTKSPLVVGNKVALHTADNHSYAGAVVEIDESSVVLEKVSVFSNRPGVDRPGVDHSLGDLFHYLPIPGCAHFQKSNIVSVFSWPSDKPTQDERHV